MTLNESYVVLKQLTISRHSNGQTFLESAVLAAIPIEPNDKALAVTKTTVFNLLLNAPSEETLRKQQRKITLTQLMEVTY